MKPLLVLIGSFSIICFGFKLFTQSYQASLSAKLAMSVMLVFTAIGHFLFTEGMAMMIPDFIPAKNEMVQLTGIIEIAAAIGLHVPGFKTTTAWLLILFFLLMLPVNINATLKTIDYQNATTTGLGVNYLWFRIPLQILFIGWVYLSTLRL